MHIHNMLPPFLWQPSPEMAPGGGVGSVEGRSCRFLQGLFRNQWNSKAWESRSIYTVPPWMKELHDGAYEPRVVSIGPHHHGKAQLEPMEMHKHRALRHFLMRSGCRKVDEVVDRFRGEKTARRLRDTYASALGAEWDDDAMLAGLMVLDGCFLLELLLTNCANQRCDEPEKRDGCYAEDDPIFGAGARRQGIVPYLRVDLLRVENQLPLWVLEELANFAHQRINLNSLVRELYETNIGCVDLQSEEPLGLHILDVYRRSLLSGGNYSGWTTPLGARDLSHHGVKITLSRGASLRSATFSSKKYESFRHSVYDYFMDPILRRGGKLQVRTSGFLHRCLRYFAPFSLGSTEWYVISAFLWCLHWMVTLFFIVALGWYVPLWTMRGELSLPPVVFEECTETVLTNLMAFEALHLGRSSESMGVTGYVVLMSSVVRTGEDVTALREKGIVRCLPERGNEEVVGILGRVTKGVVVDQRLIGEVNRRMEQVCRRKPNLWWASWRRNYWKEGDLLRSKITTLVAVYGLLVASITVVFAILTYFHQVRKPLLCAMRK